MDDASGGGGGDEDEDDGDVGDGEDDDGCNNNSISNIISFIVIIIGFDHTLKYKLINDRCYHFLLCFFPKVHFSLPIFKNTQHKFKKERKKKRNKYLHEF